MDRILFCLAVFTSYAKGFSPISSFPLRYSTFNSKTSIAALFNFGDDSLQMPTNVKDRDNQAISAIKEAIRKPRNSSLPLIECEFPALQALNKLGDGSLRSTMEAEEANLLFVSKLVKSLAPVPFIGPKVSLFVSSSATKSFVVGAKSKVKGVSLYSFKDGIPDITEDTICVITMPSSRIDYQRAQELSVSRNVSAVVLVNGFAKDPKSLPSTATMAYFLKPLTYNSQVAGYLVRSYPSKWVVIDVATKRVLASFSDEEILVKGTNTPDLRNSGKILQRTVDERAIRERNMR